MKNCSLWEGLTLEKFMENCLSWKGPHTGAGEECEESSPEEEGAAETTIISVPGKMLSQFLFEFSSKGMKEKAAIRNS
ncbi:hypothetical protein QYF61_023541 [Mycteria americana]|uniref:Uncharacterized protein n=1 Tax=Mycteria americana TaxID=33587 RepID=A0AAN7NYQ9_MYCAM|nr:hypothetical protein QYF61_023541 [Mycteria americana]